MRHNMHDKNQTSELKNTPNHLINFNCKWKESCGNTRVPSPDSAGTLRKPAKGRK